jgi:hypothetical protein
MLNGFTQRIGMRGVRHEATRPPAAALVSSYLQVLMPLNSSFARLGGGALPGIVRFRADTTAQTSQREAAASLE